MQISLLLIVSIVQLTHLIYGVINLSRNYVVNCGGISTNPFTIHIFAALAEQEAKLISSRTKAALRELKNKGVQLGKPENLTKEAQLKGIQKIQSNARMNDRNRQAKSVVESCKERGMNYRQIADHLNALNFKARYGNAFHPMSVKRLFEVSKTV